MRGVLLLLALIALAGCQGVQRAPEASSALPRVHDGDPGPQPQRGTPGEGNRWGLGGKHWRITDTAEGDFYNCLGFAMCSAAFGYRELPREPSDGMVNSQTIAKADKYFQALGWTISDDCRPKKGVRKVVVYCTPGSNQRADPGDDVVHFAKQYRDDWWEGKMGCAAEGGTEPPRILYPGVGSIDYGGGVPCRCYEMGLARLVQFIKTRVLPLIAQQRENLKPLKNSTPAIDRAERDANERIKELEDAMKAEGSGP
jgi:hypothetical protein